ncbi:hypothetical protein GCM10009830_02580 [Glycomyces endophyticus]|uniref:Uncharacterized protein n=2 Tax=Glycomyces endophyticus TaxID=480996 RepID=A0ABN2FWC5_9ACTN
MLSRAVRIGCAAGLAAFALAACGDDDADAADEAAAADDPFAAYTACLEDEGVDLPDDWSPFGEGGMPGGGEMPSGMPSDGGMPTGLPTGDMPTDLPTDMPSGGPGGGGGFGTIAAPDGVDEDDWAAATEACAAELPQGGGPGGGGAPGGGDGATDETT